MRKKTLCIPDEGETEKRISEHLAYAQSEEEKREAALLWEGYLAALGEWGMIHGDEYDRCLALIKAYPSKYDVSKILWLGIHEEGKG